MKSCTPVIKHQPLQSFDFQGWLLHSDNHFTTFSVSSNLWLEKITASGARKSVHQPPIPNTPTGTPACLPSAPEGRLPTPGPHPCMESLVALPLSFIKRGAENGSGFTGLPPAPSYLGHFESLLKSPYGVVALSFNSRTRETEAGGSRGSRSAWSTE